MEQSEQSRYFVPAPSRWPALGALALFCLGLGAALALNSMVAGQLSLLAGAAILLWMLFGWFGDVIRESLSGHYQGQEDSSFRWGMSWFIFSEVMFFAAVFGALFYVRTISVPELGDEAHQLLYPGFSASWPLQTGPGVAADYQAMGAWGLPAVNTLILLTSGATLTWAHWGLLSGSRRQLSLGLGLTVLLGLTFLALQVYELFSRHACATFVTGFRCLWHDVFYADRLSWSACVAGGHHAGGDVGAGAVRAFRCTASLRVRGGGVVLALCGCGVADVVCGGVLVVIFRRALDITPLDSGWP